MTPTDELKCLTNEIRNSEIFDMGKLNDSFPDDDALIAFCIRFTLSNVDEAFESFLVEEEN